MRLRPAQLSLALAAVMAVIALIPVMVGPPVGRAPLWFRLVFLGISGLGTLIPFATVAGGIGDPHEHQARLLRADFLLVAGLAYVMASFASPLLEARVLAYGGASVSDLLPFGPTIPGNLIDWRNAVLELAPSGYSFDVEEVLRRPPNWIEYQIYLPLAFGVFCYLNFFVGAAIAKLAHRPPLPLRRYLTWATALGWSVGYFVVVNVGREWVRAAPTHSAAVGAFLPLLLPLALIGTHRLLLSRRCTAAAGD